MALPDDDEPHVDFEANVNGKPLKFRIVAAPNTKYGPKGVDLSIRHDVEQMLADHGRDITSNERQFAILSSLYLALRALSEAKEQKEYKDTILKHDKGRWDIDE